MEGKVVIITGATSGIGRETAIELAKAGNKVVLSGRREERLKALAEEIGTDKTAWLKSDVSSLDDMQALVKVAKDKFGRVDVLYANAGVMPAGPMSGLKVNEWMSIVDINIKGVLNSMAAVLPEFTAQKSGHIIVTSSVAGIKSVPGNAVYSGSKHFVSAMLDSFRAESVNEGTNIRTTIIYPGAIKTELLNTIDAGKGREMTEEYYRQVALTPDAIANAVVYAVSQPDNVDISDIVVRPAKQAD